MNEKNVFKLWASLYDRHDQEIARYQIETSQTIGELLVTWSIEHYGIEYFKFITL
jgi:hypothetical protein